MQIVGETSGIQEGSDVFNGISIYFFLGRNT